MSNEGNELLIKDAFLKKFNENVDIKFYKNDNSKGEFFSKRFQDCVFEVINKESKDYDILKMKNCLLDINYPYIKPFYKYEDIEKIILFYEKDQDDNNFFDILNNLDEEFLNNKYYLKNRFIDAILNAEEQYLRKKGELCSSTMEVFHKDDIKKESFWNILKCNINDDTRINVNGKLLPIKNISHLKWNINGIGYEESLKDIMSEVETVVNPNSKEYWLTFLSYDSNCNKNKILDYGNLYCKEIEYISNKTPVLFSFALDTFCDVLAHPFWYFTPNKLNNYTKINIEIKDDTIFLNHNITLKEISPIRIEIFNKKIEHLWNILFNNVSGIDKESIVNTVQKIFFILSISCKYAFKNNTGNLKDIDLLVLAKAIEFGSKSKFSFVNQIWQN